MGSLFPDTATSSARAETEMDEPARKRQLLDELDTRQNHVLAELDALNDRIESLLKQHGRHAEQPMAVAPAAA